MRLYDRVLRDGPMLPESTTRMVSEAQLRDSLKFFADKLSAAAKIDVQPVAEYLYSSEQEHWSWGNDFPTLTPPFATMWLEYRVPETIYSSHIGETRIGPDAPTVGVLYWSTPYGNGWEVHTFSFALSHRENKYSFVGEARYRVDAKGMMTTEGYKDGEKSPEFMMPPEFIDAETGQGSINGFTLASLLFSPSLAISFMHCKNVVITDAPDTRTRQQRRYDERKGTKPTEFKTLVIEPMKQVLKTEGGIEQHGLKKALHICRGHFATYSEDRPLFGKYSGTFWKPAHVRGSADVGMVGKDYKIKAPKGV